MPNLQDFESLQKLMLLLHVFLHDSKLRETIFGFQVHYLCLTKTCLDRKKINQEETKTWNSVKNVREFAIKQQ